MKPSNSGYHFENMQINSSLRIRWPETFFEICHDSLKQLPQKCSVAIFEGLGDTNRILTRLNSLGVDQMK